MNELTTNTAAADINIGSHNANISTKLFLLLCSIKQNVSKE
jgi:hypothetical protein